MCARQWQTLLNNAGGPVRILRKSKVSSRPALFRASGKIASGARRDGHAINSGAMKMDRSDQKQRGAPTSPENPEARLSTPLVSAQPPAGPAPNTVSAANNLRKETRVWTRDLLIAIS